MLDPGARFLSKLFTIKELDRELVAIFEERDAVRR
jgi:hypothetical protein